MANRYIKGLNKDTSPIDQIEGTWRHAKNSVINAIKGGISNEKGFSYNETDHKLNLNVNIGSEGNEGWEATGFDLVLGDAGPRVFEYIASWQATDTHRQISAERLIGKIETSDGRVVLFTTKKQAGLSDASFADGVGNDHAIYLLNNDNKLQLVFRTLNAGKVLQVRGDALAGQNAQIYYVGLEEQGNKALAIIAPEGEAYLNIEPTGLTYSINADLNFNVEHPIQGTYKINSNGELIVYWTDNFNPPRTLNITRQLNTAEYTSVTDPDTDVTAAEVLDENHFHYYANHIYGKLIFNINTQEFSVNKDYINRLNLFPHAGPVPHVDFKTINSGGGLATAAYQLALAYADLNFTRTNYLTVSNPVYINEEPETVTPIERYDGSNAGTQTGKSITWQVTNINTDYDYLRAVIIRTMNGQEEAFQLKDMPIKNTSSIEYVTYTGIEATTSGSVTDIMVDTVSYDKAKTINQLDNVLYLGNLEGSKDVGYQKYANNIRLEATTEVIPFFDPYEFSLDNLNFGYSVATKPFLSDTDTPTFNPDFYGIQRGYRSSLYNVMKKGYTRDEVYAFYVAFILNDGTMSYAYHIPGREEIEKTLDAVKGEASVSVKETDFILGDSTPAQLDGWLDECGVPDPTHDSMWDQFPVDMQDQDLYALSGGEGRAFHFFDFSRVEGSNNMNYWQNANEFYPSTNDYDVWDETGQIGSLRGANVRHHHFPSNENADFWVINETDNNGGQVGLPPNSGQIEILVNYDSEDFSLTSTITEQTSTWTGMYPGEWVQGTGGMGVPTSSQKSIILSDAGQDYSTPPVWNGAVPPEGACIYCEVTEGGPTGNILEDQGTDGQGVDIGTNCNAWFYGTVSNNTSYGGGIKIEIGSDFNNCGCGINTIWEDGVNPCGTPVNYQSVTDPDMITSITGCAGGGILEGLSATSLNTTTDGFGGDIGDRNATTKFSGTCRWKTSISAPSTVNVTNDSGFTGTESNYYNGSYSSHDVNILGFHLNHIHIPQEIKDKVQGMRIYYANREHHNRRILGQNLSIPMRQLNTPVIAGCMQNVSSPLSGSFAENAFDNTAALATQIGQKPMWVCEGFPRNKIDFFDNTGLQAWNGSILFNDGDDNDRVHSNLCSWEGLQFHDFYLLNNKYSIAHATHMKIESLFFGLSFFSKTLINNPVNVYAADGTQTGVLANASGLGSDADIAACHSMTRRGSMQYPLLYRNIKNKDVFRNLTGGMLNYPIAENAKTYLRGNSIYAGAADIGFGHNIYNIDGESSMAFRLLAKRGLPPVYEKPGFFPSAWAFQFEGPNSQYTYNQFEGWNTGQQGDQDNPDPDEVQETTFPYSGDGLPYMTYTGDIPLVSEKGLDQKPELSALWQTNLHAFKLDMYNSLDANQLVWTGYEIIGDDFQNMNYEDGTKISYPGGIFGGDTYLCRYGFRTSSRNVFTLIGDSNNGFDWPSSMEDWRWPQYNRKDSLNTLYSTIVESTDNINFRHSGNKTNSADSYFPKSPAQEILDLPLTLDLTYNPDPETGNIRYNEDYSTLNTLKTAIPLPFGISEPTSFPTRVIRSVKNDGTSLIDNYRLFLALQFKDLPKNRGDLISLAGMNNILYMHMEDTIYATKGKETLELTDGTEAFVGSGDIFEKDPEEVMQTYYGYGGTQSQFSGITTRHGYFFLNYADRKVFLLTDSLGEISGLGMEAWFKKNIPFKFEDYPGWNFSGPATFGTFNLDNPFSNFGFTSTWDPSAKRILLTKKEIQPTKLFDYMYSQGLEENPTGWSLTYDSTAGTYTREPNLNLSVINCMTPNSLSTAIFNDIFDPFDLESDNAFVDSLYFFELANDPSQAWSGNCNSEITLNPDAWNAMTNRVCFSTENETDCTLSAFDLNEDQYDEIPEVDYNSGTGNCCLVIQPDFRAQMVRRTGWTISFYPELQIWVSFHDYIPSVYILSGETLLSGNFHEDKLYTHHDGAFGQFEYELFSNHTSWENSEFNTSTLETSVDPPIYESILNIVHSEQKHDNKTFGSISYISDVSTETESGQIANRHDPGFTSFYVYNTHQVSQETDIIYLTNTRRVGNDWKINQFRDMANLNAANNALENELVNMFTINGMNESLNLEYLDVNKDETTQRKFVDKFLGICLKNSNISNNLVTLYATQVGLRKYFR